MTAILSADGVYRYRLDREWLGTGRVVWIMLNPSTADADLDDPTIRRCVGFTKTWGYGGLTVVNVFALRATDPRELARHPRPTGPDNAARVADALICADLIVAAWGASFPRATRGHVATVAELARDLGAHHLGLTAGGHPRHPLYVRADTTPTRWVA